MKLTECPKAFSVPYGSRLFGTNIATSDYDVKSVYLHDLHSLIFNPKPTYQEEALINGVKCETEFYHIYRFADLLGDGQTTLVEMMFAPVIVEDFFKELFQELMFNRDRVISKNILPFIGFAKKQAEKYGLKGERLQTLQNFKDRFEQLSTGPVRDPLTPETFAKLLTEFTGRVGFSTFKDTRDGRSVQYLVVGGKAYGETTPVKQWRGPLEKSLNSYGVRAHQAAEDSGKDLKALLHAVRVAGEGIELLQTGKLTFPRPDVEYLLAIRRNELSPSDITDELDRRIMLCEELRVTSLLRDFPDKKFLWTWAHRCQYALLN